jgi:CRP/FNR family transcriptional regulator, cyclic AMP receptor protein
VAALEAPTEALMQNVAFKAGDRIISEGDEGDTAFFIVSGAVDVTVGRGDQARIVGRLETGEVFGEMCLIEPGPRSATVTAACDTECLATSYQEFIAAIQENPERAVGFMKTLVRRLRKMNELLENASPGHGGFRAMLLDCQTSTGENAAAPDASALSWTMLW